MKVWIDQDLCTGDGLCAEIAPDVFHMMPDGLAYVKEGNKIYAAAVGNPEGAAGLASFFYIRKTIWHHMKYIWCYLCA